MTASRATPPPLIWIPELISIVTWTMLNGHLLHGQKFPGQMYPGHLLAKPLTLNIQSSTMIRLSVPAVWTELTWTNVSWTNVV